MDKKRGCLNIVLASILFFVVYNIVPLNNSGLRYFITFLVVGIIEAGFLQLRFPSLRLSKTSLVLILLVSSIIIFLVVNDIVGEQNFGAAFASPIPVAQARLGSNLGKIIKGQRQVWTYSGKMGEVLQIRANADITPTLNLLDTYVTIYSPDGSTLAENDNPHFLDTNAFIANLKLPTTGEYKIEVRDKDNSYEGPYDLVITLSEAGTN